MDRRDVAAAIDPGDMEGVFEPVERKTAREADHVAAIDEAPADLGRLLRKSVEVDLGGVLPEARRELVLRFLHRHAVHMVDLFTDLVVVEAAGRAGLGVVPGGEVDARAGGAELRRIDDAREVGNHGLLNRPSALHAHQHPADVVEHRRAVGAHAAGAHPHHARVALGGRPHADHFGGRDERVARIDRPQELSGRVTKIGESVQRNVRHRLPENHVEGDEVRDRARRIADAPREGVGGLHHEAVAVEPLIHRHVAGRDGARRRVADDVADDEVLEEPTCPGHARAPLEEIVRRTHCHGPARPATSTLVMRGRRARAFPGDEDDGAILSCSLHAPFKRAVPS